jgi:hypothetical protein
MLLLADRQAMRVVLRFLLVHLVVVLLHPYLVLLILVVLLVSLLELLLLDVLVRVRWFGVLLRRVGRFLLL